MVFDPSRRKTLRSELHHVSMKKIAQESLQPSSSGLQPSGSSQLLWYSRLYRAFSKKNSSEPIKQHHPAGWISEFFGTDGEFLASRIYLSDIYWDFIPQGRFSKRPLAWGFVRRIGLFSLAQLFRIFSNPSNACHCSRAAGQKET